MWSAAMYIQWNNQPQLSRISGVGCETAAFINRERNGIDFMNEFPPDRG